MLVDHRISLKATFASRAFAQALALALASALLATSAKAQSPTADDVWGQRGVATYDAAAAPIKVSAPIPGPRPRKYAALYSQSVATTADTAARPPAAPRPENLQTATAATPRSAPARPTTQARTAARPNQRVARSNQASAPFAGPRPADYQSADDDPTIIPTFPEMLPVGTIEPGNCPNCQTSAVAGACPRCGVTCNGCCGEQRWPHCGGEIVPWDMLAQGEYIGPARTAHVPEYRLRVDDLIEFIYRLDGKPSAQAYKLEIGDRLKIESLSEKDVDREVVIQPDGKVSLRLIGEVRAAGRTLADLQADLEKRYKEYVQDPAISINPLEINTTAQQLISTVDRRAGIGGQAQVVRVTPAGTVQLPAIGSVPAQGLTLAELKHEVEHRYTRLVAGMEVTPILNERAARYAFVVGEVQNPGRFTLEGPTTLTQAIALAGSWRTGAHLKQIVIFRRDDNWNLVATKLDMRGTLDGKRPCPADEIWIRDSDIVIVPKSPILRADNFIELVFTRGIYGVFPLNFAVNFAKLSSI